MLVVLLSLINPGDEVILSQPFYENYWPDCVLAGASPRFVPVRPPHWRFDPDELAAAFNDRTKAIVLCNPNNPTGTVFTRDDLEAIAALCRKWDVIAITDEIYEHIIYDGRPHASIAALDGMYERSVTISGMSKTYAVTGWRIGTIIAPHPLTRRFARSTTSCRSVPRRRFRRPAPWLIACPATITPGLPPSTRPGATACAGCSGTSASSSIHPRGPTTSWRALTPSGPTTMWLSPGTWSGTSAWPRSPVRASSRTRPWDDRTSASASASEARHSTPPRNDCEHSGSLFEAPRSSTEKRGPGLAYIDLTALRLPLSRLFRIQLSPIVDVRVGLEVHEDITEVREPIEQLILDKMTDAMALIDGLISADLDVDIDEIFQA